MARKPLSPDQPVPDTADQNDKRGKRVRLSPEVRRQQILDAALDEFSSQGFGNTSMDKIASRVGITKAGIYAHFAGKDDIFEALLVGNMLSPPFSEHWDWRKGASLAEMVDALLDSIYERMDDERAIGTFRLLIAESGRAPALIQRWCEQIMKPHSDARQAFVDQCIDKGVLPDNTFTRHFSLALAPTLMALVCQMLLSGERAQQEIAAIRAGHRHLLLTMLAQE